MSLLPVTKAWVWISALASFGGWTLSAAGQLNRMGYALFIAATVFCFWILRRPEEQRKRPVGLKSCIQRIRRRFTRFLPCAFLILCGLALLGGLLYAPTNHAGLTYRTPRVLQWLSEEGWFWIHTPSYRMNNRTCGFEWLSAPILLFFRSDRPLFLINFVPFILMPGLIFSVFTRVGISSRVAWSWMWLLPTGYCFLLQAGSIGNDAFPTVYALAAMDFALRASRSGRPSDLALSMLAAAMLTGAKASNAPLLLGWAFLVLPALRRIACAWAVERKAVSPRWVTAGFLTVLVCLSASLLPTAILNVHYCGDWTGLKLERSGMDMKDPFVGIWGNGLLFLMHNFVPPFFPQAKWWNESVLRVLPESIVEPMTANFEDGYHLLWELATEDWVGLGFGLSVLLVFSFVCALLLRNRCRGAWAPAHRRLPPLLRWLVILAPWVALLVYCAKSGMVTGARIIAPYYPILALLPLVPCGHSALVRSRAWRLLAGGTVLLAFPVLMLTPARPLWPAQTVLSRLSKARPESRLLNRAWRVYSVYSTRSDPLAEVRGALPPNIRVVGFMADGDDMDISLWRPFFTRKVRHILWTDLPQSIRTREITYAVIGGAYLKSIEPGASDSAGTDFTSLLQPWLEKMGGELLSTHTAILKVNEGPQPWYIVRLKPL